jgi:hypothetical protein
MRVTELWKGSLRVVKGRTRGGFGEGVKHVHHNPLGASTLSQVVMDKDRLWLGQCRLLRLLARTEL